MNWINTIINYTPYNEQENKDKEIIIKCFATFGDILTRNNEIAHITSSGFVVNKDRDKVVMVHHNIYNSWSWTGGHADGDEDLLAVAIKEAKEETGATTIRPLDSGIITLDVLPVKGHIRRNTYVAPHLHLSVGYLLVCDETEPLVVKKDENSGVMWVPFAEVDKYSNEPHMIPLYKKIISKITASPIG